MTDERGAHAAAARALELIPDGARVGLGSGRAASEFIAQLGARARLGWQVSGVPTSRAAAQLAREVGVPLIELEDGVVLDVTVDGADEVAPNLDLVKGWGGAFVHERIVAASSRRQVIVAGEDKLVRTLGARGRVPVEVIPLARFIAAKQLGALRWIPTLRMDRSGRRPFVTENGNFIFDCAPPQPLDGKAARVLEQALLSIVGVVDTGLLLGTADMVFIGHPDGHVDMLRRTQS